MWTHRLIVTLLYPIPFLLVSLSPSHSHGLTWIRSVCHFIGSQSELFDVSGEEQRGGPSPLGMLRPRYGQQVKVVPMLHQGCSTSSRSSTVLVFVSIFVLV